MQYDMPDSGIFSKFYHLRARNNNKITSIIFAS